MRRLPIGIWLTSLEEAQFRPRDLQQITSFARLDRLPTDVDGTTLDRHPARRALAVAPWPHRPRRLHRPGVEELQRRQLDHPVGGVMTAMRIGDPFIPGLRPRGHEGILHATSGELLASLPEPGARRIGPQHLSCDEEPTAAESDLEAVRSFLHRHGHRSER